MNSKDIPSDRQKKSAFPQLQGFNVDKDVNLNKYRNGSNEKNQMNVRPFLGSVLSTESSVYYNNPYVHSLELPVAVGDGKRFKNSAACKYLWY